MIRWEPESDSEEDYSTENYDLESDYYESDTSQYDDSESEHYESDTSHFDDLESDSYDSNAASPASRYSETQSSDFLQSFMTDIVYPSLPINCTSVWEMQETIEAPTRIWDSFEVYQSKYLFRKLDDLRCVKGIDHMRKLRFKRMFVYDDYDGSKSSDPFISLPPHVQSIVEPHQECKIVKESRIERINRTDDLLIIYVNARGLKNNFASFKYLVDHSHPHVVCVSETNNPDPEEVHLPGYYCDEFTESNRKSRGCSGGVMIYVQNNLNYRRMKKSFELANSETAWIELKSHGSESQNIVVGVVYRHPKPKKEDITDFQWDLSTFLRNHIAKKKAVYILGDINIDLLQHSHKFIEYCEALADQNFKLLITKPTRVEKRAETLIDHIYARDSKRAESGIISFDREDMRSPLRAFDHFPVYCKI